MAFTALLDASVLFPSVLRDTLLRLAEAELYRPIWSAAILGDVQRSVLGQRPTVDAARLERTLRQMNEAFDDACVEGWQALEGNLQSPDPGDRHVLAAAIVGAGNVLRPLWPQARGQPASTSATIRRRATKQAATRATRLSAIGRRSPERPTETKRTDGADEALPGGAARARQRGCRLLPDSARRQRAADQLREPRGLATIAAARVVPQQPTTVRDPQYGDVRMAAISTDLAGLPVGQMRIAVLLRAVQSTLGDLRVPLLGRRHGPDRRRQPARGAGPHDRQRQRHAVQPRWSGMQSSSTAAVTSQPRFSRRLPPVPSPPAQPASAIPLPAPRGQWPEPMSTAGVVAALGAH